MENNLIDDVVRFLDVYRFLPAEAKGMFESQLKASIKDKDNRTKQLYLSLLQSAKSGETVERAVAALQQIN